MPVKREKIRLLPTLGFPAKRKVFFLAVTIIFLAVSRPRATSVPETLTTTGLDPGLRVINCPRTSPIAANFSAILASV